MIVLLVFAAENEGASSGLNDGIIYGGYFQSIVFFGAG